MLALGYHIYAGGFTLGVAKHFKVLGHLEHEPGYGAKTCQANFPKLDIRIGEKNWNLNDYRGDECITCKGKGMDKKYNYCLKCGGTGRSQTLDFLYGNPPCAAFSIIGKHHGAEDPRLHYHKKFRDIAAYLQPTVAVLESVRGMLKKGESEVEAFEKMCEKNDYGMYIVNHDAQYLGVPQARKRVFLVASKARLNFFKYPLTEPIPIMQAIKGVKDIDKHIVQPATSHKHTYLIKHTRPGESLDQVFDRVTHRTKRGNHHSGGISGRPSFCIVRPHPDKVSGAVIGYVKIHPTKDRWMNINEYKALCTYPQDYKILEGGNIESAAKLLTRAVMPGVGEWIAKVVKAGIKSNLLPEYAVKTVNVEPNGNVHG